MPKISENDFPYVELAEGTTPTTPATGIQRVYMDNTGLMFRVDDAGAEHVVGGRLVGCQVLLGTQSIPNGAWTAVDLGTGTVAYDTDSMLDTTNDNIEAPYDGYYFLTGQVWSNAVLNDQDRLVVKLLAGTEGAETQIARSGTMTSTGGNAYQTEKAIMTAWFDAGETFKMEVYHNQGAAQNITGGSLGYSFMEMVFVGAAKS